MEPRISLITLGVEDVAEAATFYERLGWKRAESPPEVAFFQAGGSIFGLYGRESLAKDANLPPEAAPKGIFARSTLAYNGRSKDEVDAVLKEAEAAGATIIKKAQDVFWGGYSGYFADPDGHLWEVAWNPFFPIAEDGSISFPE